MARDELQGGAGVARLWLGKVRAARTAASSVVLSLAWRGNDLHSWSEVDQMLESSSSWFIR